MGKSYKEKRASRHYMASLGAGSDLVVDKRDVAIVRLQQRGIMRGWVSGDYDGGRDEPASLQKICALWNSSEPVVLSGFIGADLLAGYEPDIERSYELMHEVLDGKECNALFAREPYSSRLSGRFEILASIYDENDIQEIEKIESDVVEDGKIVAENLWVKLSWLSFIEDDASLRFRFSFGIESYEDVAADPVRQRYAAEFTEAIFPESAIISRNGHLDDILRKILDARDIAYVERIVFFNAPNGGAQFHQDVEKGHRGVVFAQLRGRSGWFCLSKRSLIKEIQRFLSRDDAFSLLSSVNSSDEIEHLYSIVSDDDLLSAYMDEQDNEPLERLLNHIPAFARQLIERGFFYIVEPGDIVLLPQQDMDNCAWHAVLCLDDFAGEALSFAIRAE